MNRSKALYYKAAALLPTGVLKKMAPPASLLPYHHLVSDEEVLHVKHLYPYKNVRQFTEDLDQLLRRLRPVPVEEIVQAVLSGRKTPAGCFLLTFDDGFREVYDVIAPILYAKGVPAIFFVNPAFLDNRLLFYRCKISLVIDALLRRKGESSLVKGCEEILRVSTIEEVIRRIREINNTDQELLDRLAVPLEVDYEGYLAACRPFMTVAQVRELAGKGFTIGAHSWDHPYYDLVSPEERQRQTLESVKYVCEQFAPPYKLFSFPHSDAKLPQSFFDRLPAGPASVDVFFGIQNQLEEPANRMLHRFNAERPDLPMARQLNGVLLWMLLKKWSRRYRVRR